MGTELLYLALVTVFTALMWVPYILHAILVRGVVDVVGYPEKPKPVALWAARMQAAHRNAVENLVVFAALVLTANALGVSSEATVVAAQVYLWARVVHFAVFALAIPWLRTLAFVTGFACQVVIALRILAYA